MKFCEKLNQKGNVPAGLKFTLPTEAQWEYAARGGKKGKGYVYSGSNAIDEVAWYNGNSGRRTHPVATKSPNELGLYDMSGNVSERCLDWYGEYGSGAKTNPAGPSNDLYRVHRGGGWYSDAGLCRSANRNYNSPGSQGYDLGFRLALVPVQ